MARFVAAGPPSLPELAILVAASTATALVFFKLRLPGGLMFGAMLASAILHGAGFIHSILPWWVAYAAVIGIGAVTGSRFANTDPYTLLRFLGAALGSFAVAMAVASLSVLVLTMLMSVRPADAVLAFAPGAQDTMMVLALALHLDPVFVGALQLSRFLLVSMLVPFLAHRIRRAAGRTPRRAHPPGATRPEIEDKKLDGRAYSAASGRCLQRQAELLPDLDQGLGQRVDQPVVVIRRRRDAQPLGALRHGRIVDRLDVDAVLGEQQVARRLALLRIADHHRHDMRRRNPSPAGRRRSAPP